MRYETWFQRVGRLTTLAIAALLVVTAASCSGVLDVEDPQTFSADDVSDPAILPAVAAGVEGSLHQAYDDLVVYTGLLSDELEDTSTWIDWADISLGRIRGDWPTGGNFSGPQNALLRARFSAQNAAERFKTVLGESEAPKSEMYVQVKAVEAWTDLIIGQAYCEGPLVGGGPREPDTKFYAQAVTKLTEALTLANAATFSTKAAWVNFVRAGRARANLFAGNLDAALADAQSVPDGFEKLAVFSENSASQQSLTGNQLHQNRNRSGSLRRLWWSMVDTANNNVTPTPVQHVKDPWSGQNDPRMQVVHPRGRLGVNNSTLHYSIEKYKDRGNDIVLTSKREMNLIEAEVHWKKGNFQAAIDALNRNRALASVNLPPLTNPGTSAGVFDRLLSERFAVLFVEGHRLQDLYRFNLVTQRLGPGRATKLPMSRDEIINNNSMKEGEATCPAIS